MYRLSARIEIYGRDNKKWVFDKVKSVVVEKDINTLTDICTIVIPSKVKWNGSPEFLLGYGDRVSVSLGYDNELQNVFDGYLMSANIKSPITLVCQDAMCMIKGKLAKKNVYEATTLDEVIYDQNMGIKHEVAEDIKLGNYRVAENTLGEFFKKLAEIGIKCFIKTVSGVPVLKAGVTFQEDDKYKAVFSEKNMIDISELKVCWAKDMKVKVILHRTAKGESPEPIIVGDDEGVIKTLHFDEMDEQTAKEWAEREYKKLKYDGVAGSFTTFGVTLLDKMDNVAIKLGGQRKGIYQVEKNVIKYNEKGLRQIITLGVRVK